MSWRQPVDQLPAATLDSTTTGCWKATHSYQVEDSVSVIIHRKLGASKDRMSQAEQTVGTWRPSLPSCFLGLAFYFTVGTGVLIRPRKQSCRIRRAALYTLQLLPPALAT